MTREDRPPVDEFDRAGAVPASAPPLTVRVAVALLVLLVVGDVVVFAVEQLFPVVGRARDLFGIVTIGVIAVVGARAVLRRSRTGRILLLCWASAGLVVGVVLRVVEPFDAAAAVATVRAVVLVALVVVLALPPTRRWCEVSSQTGPRRH